MKDRILKVLKKIEDPEVGLSIVELGLIYEVKSNEKIFVRMTLTSPFCPLSGFLVERVKEELKKEFNKEVEVEITFDPPWTPERMSKKARKKLGLE